MDFKYKNYKLNLDEDLQKLQKEVDELKKLNALIKENDAYYLLSGKTQLIGKNRTVNARSRKDHSDNIVLLAKRFIKALYETVVDEDGKESKLYQLNLERDLLYAEITARIHDWGHTPFGHLGERCINDCLQHTDIIEEDVTKILQRKKEIYGEDYELQQGHIDGKTKFISFEHNEQSAKMFYDFVHQNDVDTNKINVQRIIHAILAHSTSRVREEYIPDDIVAQIIRQADKIEEYTTNDFEEIKQFINLGKISDKTLSTHLKLSKSERIKEILQELLEETLEKGKIDDEMQALKCCRRMKKFHHKCIFLTDNDGKRGLLTGENEERITLMLKRIIDYYMHQKASVPLKTSYIAKPLDDVGAKRVVLGNKHHIEGISLTEKVIDYICSMDNEKVETTYYRLVKERMLGGKGKGIEPIRAAEIEKVKSDMIEKEIHFRKLQEEIEGSAHSREECETSFNEEIQQIKREFLTPEAIQRMHKVRNLHQEENLEDVRLCELVCTYDDIQNNRQRIKTNETILSNKIQQTKKNVETKWNQTQKGER